MRLLGDIAIVTHCVASLAPVEKAWSEFLGYSSIARGTLSPELCAAWATPAVAGQPYCLMAPASGEPVYLRFIETGEPVANDRHATWGWTATEILVQDPDGLARRLEGSPFRRLGGPGNLYPWERAPRAMQVRGPARELLYLTRILPNSSRYGMKGARSEVDRVFIVTVGGPSLAPMHHFYGGVLGLRVIERAPIINGILARDCGVSPMTVFPSSIVRIPGRRFLLELDQLPVSVSPQYVRHAHLPPGMAMVSFRTPDLNAVTLPLRAVPQVIEEPPYEGRRTAVIAGAAGEWLELIESGA